MARPKKPGRRAKGIQGRQGYLYIIHYQKVYGKEEPQKLWIPTKLEDIPENVSKAVEIQKKLLHRPETNLDPNISLAEYLDKYIAYKKRSWTDTTYSNYLNRGKYIKEYLGTKKVRNLSVSDVEFFLDQLFAEKKLQSRSVRDIKSFLKTLMGSALKDALVMDNPVDGAKINKDLASLNDAPPTDMDFFLYEEAVKFLDYSKDNRFYEYFYCTLFFGLRREEALGIKWSAVDLTEKTLTIQHTVTKGTKINRLNRTKSESSYREYPLNDEQIRMFSALRKKEEVNQLIYEEAGLEYYKNDYVFKSENGRPYHPDTPGKVFKKIIRAHPDLPQDITLHGLRTSCVSLLVNAGWDIKSIQNWVGHADIETTLKIYTKIREKEAKKKLSEGLSNMIALKEYDTNGLI